jgi:hypothetical protein
MPLPPYDHAHSHPLDAVVGYDVVRTSWEGKERLNVVVEVTDVVDGATRAAHAQALAYRHRSYTENRWGYTAPRYACGCRWLGTLAPTTALFDLEPRPMNREPTSREVSHGITARPPLELIAATARDRGWEPLESTPSRIVWRKEVGDHYRRIEIAPDREGKRPLAAVVVHQNAPEPHTVDFLDQSATLFTDICDALWAAP